jgi:hypothetical protein
MFLLVEKGLLGMSISQVRREENKVDSSLLTKIKQGKESNDNEESY